MQHVPKFLLLFVVNVFLSDKLNSGLNFLAKADTAPLVKYVRVTYVRPKYGLPPGGLPVPKVLSFRTFIPDPQSKAESDVSPEFEPLSAVWERNQEWMSRMGEINRVDL